MTSPAVSVIIPVYNAEKYLKECLDSVLGQSLESIEVICVDAGSQDGSLAILNAYAQKDMRIQVISGLGRLDAGAARNAGLEKATGRYLSFLDSDDIFDPRMLEAACQRAEEDRADIVVFQAQQLDMRTGAVTPMPWSLVTENCPPKRSFAPEEMAERLFNSFENWTWNKLFSAEFIRGAGIVFQSIRRTNDMAFVWEALARARRVSLLPETFVSYRVGTGTSLQQTNDQSPDAFWDAYLETQRRLKAAGLYETYEQSFVNKVLSGCLYNLNSVKSDSAYQDILFRLRYEAQALGLREREESYFYEPQKYQSFLKVAPAPYKAPDTPREPLVSVVLPCLNSREYIRECVNSVLTQTLEQLELLIVDAGSTDGTLEIARQYESLDPRVRVICSDQRSYGYQMNLGLKAAKGKYLGIVESDDYVQPQMFEELYEKAEANRLEVLKGNYTIFTGSRNRRQYKRMTVNRDRSLYNRVIDPARTPKAFESYVVSWSGIYSVAFLREHAIWHHESPGASFQDNGFWFQVFTQAHRVMFCPCNHYMLRRDNPGSSIYNAAKARCMFKEYDFIRDFLTKHPDLEEKYAPLCALKRFKNSLWAYNTLVQPEGQDAYLKEFADHFKALTAAGEIDPDLYTPQEQDLLKLLLADPALFKVRAAKGNVPVEYQTAAISSSNLLRKMKSLFRLIFSGDLSALKNSVLENLAALKLKK